MIRNSQEHAFPEPPTADRDWFGGRRWTGIAASGVILLVIVVALFLLVRPHDPESAGPVRASASNTSMTSSAPEAMTPSSGSTSRLDVSPPTAVPAGISWSLYQSVALPSSSTAGPLTLDGDIATGYAHTPVGALIAAANISTRYFLALDSDYRQAAEAMTAPGVGRDAWIALRAKESHPTADPAGTYAQIAGFNFLSYSPADSVVQLATRAADGSLQQFRSTSYGSTRTGGSCCHRAAVSPQMLSLFQALLGLWPGVARSAGPVRCPRHRRGLSRGGERHEVDRRRCLRRNRERLR